MRAAWSSSTTLGIVRHMARARYDRRQSIRQLSSGKRITCAADDAAGLGVAVNLEARTRSLKVARYNAESAVQAVQMADGGMAEIQVMLIRLKELAMQTASETISDNERVAAQAEVNALLGEIDSIAWTTRYNDIPLLAQAHLDVAFLLDTSGSMVGELANLTASITDFRQSFLDAAVDVQFGLAAMRGSLDSVDNVNLVVDIGGANFESALASLPLAAGSVDAYSGLVNVTGVNDFNNDGDVFGWREDVARHVIVVTDTHQEVPFIPGDPSQAEVAADLTAAGFTVHVIAPPSKHGSYSTITTQTGGSIFSTGDPAGNGIPDAMDSIATNLTGGGALPNDAIDVQVGIHGTENDQISLGLPADASQVGLGLTGLNVTTREDALEALGTLDTAIANASGIRARIGAADRRLGHTINYQTVAIEDETAALSRIEDLDYAAAVGELILNETLASASTSLLFDHLDIKRNLVLSLYGYQLGNDGGGEDRRGTFSAAF